MRRRSLALLALFAIALTSVSARAKQHAGGFALDVSARELARLGANATLANLSGDLPVAADDLIANKTTAAEKVWAGTNDLLGLMSTPGYNGTDIGVALVDGNGFVDDASR